MAGGGDGGGWWDIDDVERWAAGARARDAVDARVRERWLRRQAEDDAGFAGLLVDLAERASTVVVVTAAGRALVGAVEAVGADFVAVGTPGGRTTLVALGGVAAVKVAPGAGRRAAPTGPAADSRPAPPPRSVTLANVLAHVVERRPRVQVYAGAALVAGELRAVGADVATVHTDGNPPGLSYVRLASVSEVSLLDSG